MGLKSLVWNGSLPSNDLWWAMLEASVEVRTPLWFWEV